jgi:hypothetical protein
MAALRDANGSRARLELAQARVLRTDGDIAAVEAALDRARAAAEATGGRVYIPFIHLERAELARRCGDDAACRRERREAQRLFIEIGATARAEQLAPEV